MSVFHKFVITSYSIHYTKLYEDLTESADQFHKKGTLLKESLLEAKQYGFSDKRIARLWRTSEDAVRRYRHEVGIRPVYKRVDTCGAEFEAFTPYLYSTYEEECEASSYNFV